MCVDVQQPSSSVSSQPLGCSCISLICHLASFGSVTLDTPMNRKFMPDADFSSWTPLEYIAEWVLKEIVIVSSFLLKKPWNIIFSQVCIFVCCSRSLWIIYLNILSLKILISFNTVPLSIYKVYYSHFPFLLYPTFPTSAHVSANQVAATQPELASDNVHGGGTHSNGLIRVASRKKFDHFCCAEETQPQHESNIIEHTDQFVPHSYKWLLSL